MASLGVANRTTLRCHRRRVFLSVETRSTRAHLLPDLTWTATVESWHNTGTAMPNDCIVTANFNRRTSPQHAISVPGTASPPSCTSNRAPRMPAVNPSLRVMGSLTIPSLVQGKVAEWIGMGMGGIASLASGRSSQQPSFRVGVGRCQPYMRAGKRKQITCVCV